MRYWVYSVDEVVAGPFPNYDEAFQERQFLSLNLAGVLGATYFVRTDEFASGPADGVEDLPEGVVRYMSATSQVQLHVDTAPGAEVVIFSAEWGEEDRMSTDLDRQVVGMLVGQLVGWLTRKSVGFP